MKKITDYEIGPSTLNRIAQIERFTGTWIKIGNIQPAIIQRLKKSTIITSSGASTRIEGALLSDTEVENLIDNGCKISRVSSRSDREVIGYINTLKFIYKEGRALPVSEHSIRSLHQLMTADFTSAMLPKKQRGSYKDVPNSVVEKNEDTGEEKIWFETTAPGPATVTAMSKLIETYHKLVDAGLADLVIIAWFIVHFLAIHPFRDGNGRLSRLITIWLLLKHQYTWVQYVSHEKFVEDNKELYYVSLRKTQGSLNSGKAAYHYWFDFFMMILSRQVSFLEKELKTPALGPVINPLIKNLNKNESMVFSMLEKQGELGISKIEREISMSRDGLKKLLKRLVDQAIIIRMGKGPSTKYKISSH